MRTEQPFLQWKKMSDWCIYASEAHTHSIIMCLSMDGGVDVDADADTEANKHLTPNGFNADWFVIGS